MRFVHCSFPYQRYPSFLVRMMMFLQDSQTNEELIYDSNDSQGSTDESYIPKNEDQFSELEQRLDMLQNFFLQETSNLRREMKDLIRTTFTANTDQVSDDNEFSGVDENLKFLRDECRNKDKIISILLENLFERENTNVSYKDNSAKFSQSKMSETEFRNPKRPLKINSIRNNSNREPLTTFNRFDFIK